MSRLCSQAELDKLTRDPKSPYRNVSDPKHKSAVAKANRLYARVAKAEERAAGQSKREPMKPGPQNRIESIERELKAAISDPAYRHPGPGHAEAVARAERLYRERYGDE